jgi:Glycosyltransferase
MSSVCILSVIPYKIYPAHSGGQRAISLLNKYLAQTIKFEAIGPVNNEDTSDYTLHRVISSSVIRYINPLLFFYVKKYAKQIESTHLLFDHPYYGWLIFLCKMFLPYKIIVRSHNIEYLRFKSIGKKWWRLLKVYETFTYKIADRIWFITEEDATHAEKTFRLSKNQISVIPYGTEHSQAPTQDEFLKAQQWVKTKYQIPANDAILLFNGALQYKPNSEAVNYILKNIVPLLDYTKMPYHVLICGKGLPIHLADSIIRSPHITYTGFVQDIEPYYLACDLFLNPVIEGGGIKTKLVEALGAGKVAISTRSGAQGINARCTQRLIVTDDFQWKAFAESIITTLSKKSTLENDTFYKEYNWNRIAQKAVESLKI